MKLQSLMTDSHCSKDEPESFDVVLAEGDTKLLTLIPYPQKGEDNF